jgi:hypothetical protein
MRDNTINAIIQAIDKRVGEGKPITTLNQLRELFPDASRDEIILAMRNRLTTKEFIGGHTINGIPVIRKI